MASHPLAWETDTSGGRGGWKDCACVQNSGVFLQLHEERAWTPVCPRQVCITKWMMSFYVKKSFVLSVVTTTYANKRQSVSRNNRRVRKGTMNEASKRGCYACMILNISRGRVSASTFYHSSRLNTLRNRIHSIV